tara:strand:+ start:38 stop:490 length:453 start_codon:yes stop_codon:yes gene_type:complete
MSGGGRYNQMVVHGAFQPRKLAFEKITADTTLTPTDSGKVIFLGSNGVDVTLPSTPEAGLNYKIIMAADYASAVCTVTIDGSGEFFAGVVSSATHDADADSAVFNGSSNDKITFASGSLAGDYVDIICDGSLWFVSGMAAVVAGIGASDS